MLATPNAVFSRSARRRSHRPGRVTTASFERAQARPCWLQRPCGLDVLWLGNQPGFQVLELLASDQALLQQGRESVQLVRDRLRCLISRLLLLARLGGVSLVDRSECLREFYPQGSGRFSYI